jgi:hypothetical protein
MNEIITLQFGNYSNFVASHYWNIQESQFVYRDEKLNNHDIPDINHDVLFREGIDSMVSILLFNNIYFKCKILVLRFFFHTETNHVHS